MHKYKQILSIAFLLCLSGQLFAQFGVRAKYNLNTFSAFDEYVDGKVSGPQDKMFDTTLGIGVDYWFRLKNYRIEFLPEIHMGLASSTEIGDALTKASFSYLGFNFNTQIYIFDLEGDCDCPTFSKQGPSLNKGIFLNLSPGLMYNSRELTTAISSAVPAYQASHINLKLGIGVGYDIGINDLFTITPMINYNLVPNVLFNDLAEIDTTPADEPDVISSSLSQIQFQLRLGFRPDYVKSYGRR